MPIADPRQAGWHLPCPSILYPWAVHGPFPVGNSITGLSKGIDSQTFHFLKLSERKYMNTLENTNYLPQSMAEQIVAIAVTDDKARHQCLSNIAGKNWMLTMRLEHAFFDSMALFDSTYKGGWWEFFQLSNGGFYIALKDDRQFHMVSPNGFECDVGANTAGIIISAFTYSNLSFGPNGEAFGEEYYKLSDFIFQHAEAGTICAALD
jgi:hypothetical protein